MSARHHHEHDDYWGDYSDSLGSIEEDRAAEREERERLERIDRSIQSGYKANNGKVSGRFLEYVDITTMRADLQFLLERVRALRGAA
jgi:hypothetical protein